MTVIKDGLIFVPRITGASALDVLKLFSSPQRVVQGGYVDNKIIAGCLQVNRRKKRKLHRMRYEYIDSEVCGLLAVSGES